MLCKHKIHDKITSSWSRSSGVEQLPLKEMVGGSNPPEITILEIEAEVGAALAAPPSADSAAKGKFTFSESRRKKE